MKNNLFALTFLAFSTVFVACKSDADGPMPHIPGAQMAVIGNEGAFGTETAGLTLVNLDAGTAEQNIYAQSNDDQPLGDVLQSMKRRGDEIYLVVNNSAKIEVVDAYSFVHKRTISIASSSPRYMVFLSDDKAYVSDLFATGLHIVNPRTGTYEGMLDLGIAAEHLMMYNDKVYATCPGADSLLVIDPATDSVIDGIGVGAGADDLATDAQGLMWIMANGAWDGSEAPALNVVDPELMEEIRTYHFPAGTGFAGPMAMAPDGQRVYYIANGDLYQMAVDADSLPSQPLVSAGSRNFYGLAIDPDSEAVFVMDAVDFLQNGKVYVFGPEGVPMAEYPTGIAPSSVLWLGE